MRKKMRYVVNFKKSTECEQSRRKINHVKLTGGQFNIEDPNTFILPGGSILAPAATGPA
jgi:hypothetical protein